MIGKIISHYKILEKLGEGGMGVVYKAEDTKLKRMVALKFLPIELTRDNAAKERFIQEAQAAAALDHINICAVHEIDESKEGQIFIVMGYYEGVTLKEKIEKGTLKIEEALKIAIQVSEGLNDAHENGIVHRDIKSANIMVTDKDIAKILDFGLAKLKGVSQLTREQSTLGTVNYMSPEQSMGKEVDHRTDIWSLGVALYEMLTGELPFKGDYEQAVIYSILNEEPEPVTSLISNIPMPFEQIINKCLSKKMSDRYQHVDDLLADLRKFLQISQTDISILKEEIVTGAGSTVRRMGLPLILFLAVILTLAGLFFLKERKTEKVTHEVMVKSDKPQLIQWQNSIAVMPFMDMSEKKDQEWFCDGMTEDILSKLARIDELKVISRTSVMQYKHTKKTIKTIGAELGVKTVLEGSIRKAGDRIRVTAQLINVADDTHLWTDTFDRKLDNVFDLQDDVSRAIAKALELKFTPDQFKIEQPGNFEAYENFQQYRYRINMYLMTQKEEHFDQIMTFARKSLNQSPANAQIHCLLGYAYYLRYTLKKIQEDLQLSIRNFQIAYQLNPNLSETNASISLVYLLQEEYQKSAVHLKKALELNTNVAEINHAAGYMLYRLGLYKKALPYFIKAEKLNPLFLFTPNMLVRIYLNLGQLGDARIFLEKSQQLAPKYIGVLVSSAELQMKMGHLEEAEKFLAKAFRLKPDDSFLMANRAYLFALKKNSQKALEIPIEETLSKGQLYSLLDMKDKAFEYLFKGSEQSYLRLKNNSFYKNLSSDPRYQKILVKLKRKYEGYLTIFKDL